MTAVDTSEVRLLVRSPNPLGDACMAFPAVRALSRTIPGARVWIACRENLVSVWESLDEVEGVISFPKSYSPWQVGKEIRRAGKFDGGVLFPNSIRSALEFRCGGVGQLVGTGGSGRGLLLTKKVPPMPPERRVGHHFRSYLRIAETAGADVSDTNGLLALPAPPTPIEAGRNGIHLGVCPGAEYGNAKRYPVERYAAAIELLRGRRPDLVIRVSVYGSPAEREIGDELVARIAEPAENRAGKTSLADLVAQLKTCHLVASNDTGTMHLAAALGVPVVAVFGSTEPAWTAPLGEIHRVVREPVDCSPCFLKECPIDYRCMLRIAPERVADEMASLLEVAV